MIFSIGVVIPTFVNSHSGIERLRETLNSITRQTFQPVEVVITDDSSENYSAQIQDIVRGYDFLNVKYVQNSGSKGVSANSNFGIALLSSLFVHCLHQDDSLLGNDCYEKLKLSYGQERTNWFLLGGVAGNKIVQPDFKMGLLPIEMYLGLNTIGGPSAVVFLRDSGARFDSEYSMLCDIKFLIDARKALGAPKILPGQSIAYGVGDWQLQREISEAEFIQELIRLNLGNISITRKAFFKVLSYPKRFDVKVRALLVLYEVTNNPSYKIAFIILTHARSLKKRLKLTLLR